jgi:hypothetical protein
LRQFDPVFVGIEHHRYSSGGSKRRGRQRLLAASLENFGMDLVYSVDLEGDVTPAASSCAIAGRKAGLLFQNDQRLTGPKRRTPGSGFFPQAERIGVEAPVRSEIADGEANADLSLKKEL